MSAAELHELKMSPQELAERTQKVSELLRKNEPTPKVQEAVETVWIDSATAVRPLGEAWVMESVEVPVEEARKKFGIKPPRAPRSDRGKKRKPEPVEEPQKAGAITKDQREQLNFFAAEIQLAERAYGEAARNIQSASERLRVAEKDFADFVDSLTKG